MDLKLAELNKANIYFSCIEDARAYHASFGFTQWGNTYPTLETIHEDINCNRGFAFYDNSNIVGYCSLLFDEPVYKQINGSWVTNNPYVVVHRIAFSKDYRGKGLAHNAFELIKEFAKEHGIQSVRVDTMDKNLVMQRVLTREGFTYCGIVQYDKGPRLAYEWVENNG